ncbi:MAG: alpha/beta hydrolase [Ruminococcus sp.]|nr:alpha/beta hydrolase [Ruminococcus sp.]
MYDKITLTPDYSAVGVSGKDCKATLQIIAPDFNEEMGKRKRRAVIVVPGGGYEFVSEREAEPVALKFAGAGFAAFVLRYSVYKKKFPTALLELAAAVKYVRENADTLDIDKDRITVLGFSAGGHLAACMANMWNSSTITYALCCKAEDIKVNTSVLCYPVITSGEKTHEGSIENLIGERKDAELREYLSLENRVGEQTPPTFIWHCADDGCVPVENSLYYMSALAKNKIQFEAHIYPYGGHGLSLCNESTACGEWHNVPFAEDWADKCIDFLKRN